nr:receptor-type tyrosine-protein phosphatase epsilon-like [Lytechinus pictus]
MLSITSYMSDFQLTTIAVCVLCVTITTLIWCLWLRRSRTPRRRQSRIDMEYAVKFSYPRRLTQSGTGNGEVTTDKSSAIVSITQYTPEVHPRSDSLRAGNSIPPLPPPETKASYEGISAIEYKHMEPKPSPAEYRQEDRDEQRNEQVDEALKGVESTKLEDNPKTFQSQDSTQSHGYAQGATIGPVSVDEFVDHVKEMKKDTGFFDDEWARLYDHRYMPQSFALMEANFKKNRYKNILPYDHTRVILDLINGDPNSDYVNASYIQSFTKENTYIASQGPNATSISDFWRMVWQKEIETIVMVTNLVDRGKIKCEKYWPDQGEELFFEDMIVSCEAEIHGIHDARRSLIIHKGDEIRILEHFHFTRWPDKGVPRNVSVLLRFIQEVNTSHDQKSTPLLVHCSAGVGRTGVVIALDNEMRRSKQTGFVDIFNFVKSMRQCRPQMVQTPEQYEFIHDAMLEYLVGHDTMIPRDRFVEHLTEMENKPEEDGAVSKLHQEFRILNQVCHEPPIDASNMGRMEENSSKNRYQNVLPRDTHRPLLISFSTNSCSEYINATFCQGYKDRERIITTQMPLPQTVTDFLRLIYDYRISTVIMLNGLSDEDSSSMYWDGDNPNILLPFSIDILDVVKSDHWTERTIELKHRKNTRVVQHFQFQSWEKVDSTEFYQTLLDFMNIVTCQQGDDSPILVHCLSGVGRTGVFCVVKMCLDQLEYEDAVDVFQIVKTLKNDNFQMIQSLEDYRLCYRILNHLMAMSQDSTFQSVQDFQMEKDECLSESLSAKTADDGGDVDGDDDNEEEEDDDVDPNAYYVHTDDDDDDGGGNGEDQNLTEEITEL